MKKSKKSEIWLIAAGLFLIFSLTNCGTPPKDDDSDPVLVPPPPGGQVSLTTSVSPANSCVITPNQGTYDPGTIVNLTVQVLDGFQFDLWQNTDNNYTATTTVIMDANKQVGVFCIPKIYYVLEGQNFSPFTTATQPYHFVMAHSSERGISPSVFKILSLPESELRPKMEQAKNDTKIFKTYSVTGGMEKAGPLALQMGKKLVAGAYISGNAAQDQAEINSLIAMALRGEVYIAVVGNEYVLFHDNSTAANLIISYLRQVRAALPPGIPIAYADTYNILQKYPQIVAECDIVLCNVYPYWEGTDIKYAVYRTRQVYYDMVDLYGKPVILGEVGWPSGGNIIGKAEPSVVNAARYFNEFISWARQENILYFYFEAFDEPWKATIANPQEGTFGYRTKDGVLKPGMQPVFDGHTVTDTWSGKIQVGGTGTASIAFTSVPPLGSKTWIQGQVNHVKPAETKVILFIFTGFGWYNKPTFAEPDTMIFPDGWWTNNITTGTNDEFATQIKAYLVPIGFTTPHVENQPIPASVTAAALAWVSVSR